MRSLENTIANGVGGGLRGHMGRGRGRGVVRETQYSFSVVLLNPENQSVPRGATRTVLNADGRIRQFVLSKGTPRGQTYQKLLELFPILRFVLNTCLRMHAYCNTPL